ncbi:heavy metal resistance protein CzcC [Neoasaia chiangmaiensis]|uniref:Heavy metal resistance protein CzcC n=1 Tax=Neoasaia chiangmaiensis TaxID=320497 RepID=A0A1U9KV49_9PROT|nr:heavy metal resistance protein CzcC [Neoasaia chiangmaiensis]
MLPVRPPNFPTLHRRLKSGHLFAAMIASAAPASVHAESLHDAIQAAWTIDPVNRANHIDADAAHKTATDVDSWFPGGPILSGEYFDDHFIGSKVGYTTYQGGISVPLWLPGQGTATVRNALADEAVSRARVKVQRLLVAVHVLDLTSTAALLQREIGNLTSARDILDRFVLSSRQALQSGEIAATDHEAIIGEKEDLDSRIDEQKQRLESTRAELEGLTGSDDIPDLMSLDGRTLAASGAMLDPQNDPRIQMADAVARGARASFDVARHSYMPNPEVGVMLARQEQYGSPWDTQIGVQFQIPLPSKARNTPMVMKEVRAMGAADRDATLAQRKVRVEYRQTRAQLASALDILRHARATQTALDSRATHLQQAWQVGEAPVIEYIRARRAALDARQRAVQADVIWHAAMVRILLMAGQTL